jgi:hypothetical protein
VVSLCGSTTFFVYGALIESVPILITNGSIAMINIWFLRREFASGGPHGRDLGVSRIRADSPFLADFVAFHLVDIHRFQPDFHVPVGDDVVTLLLNRDGLPAGLLIGRRDGTALTIDLDYVLGRTRRFPPVADRPRPLRTRPLNRACLSGSGPERQAGQAMTGTLAMASAMTESGRS